MPLRKLYVIARGVTGRPTCQHKLVDGTSSVTRCGRDVSNWSRHFMANRIEPVLCLTRACRS